MSRYIVTTTKGQRADDTSVLGLNGNNTIYGDAEGDTITVDGATQCYNDTKRSQWDWL